MSDVLLTAKDLAVRWQVSVGHLANMRSAGLGPAYRRLGSAVRYNLSDIEAYERDAFVATDEQPAMASHRVAA